MGFPTSSVVDAVSGSDLTQREEAQRKKIDLAFPTACEGSLVKAMSVVQKPHHIPDRRGLSSSASRGFTHIGLQNWLESCDDVLAVSIVHES